MNLTKIKTPFGLLSEKKKAALKAHCKDGGKIEAFLNSGTWGKSTSPHWYSSVTYRAKPEPALTKPTVPWEVVADKWICAARDENGKIYLYDDRPTLFKSAWYSLGQNVNCSMLKADPGTCDWKDSLVYRPGCEPEESV